MADPRYSVVMIGGVPVVDAPQEIDVGNARYFRKILLVAASRGNGTVVVNMAATRFLDSSAVGVLARMHQRATSAGGQLLLVIPANAVVLPILAFTGLDQLIPRFGDLNEALEEAHAIVPRPLQRPAASSGEARLPRPRQS